MDLRSILNAVTVIPASGAAQTVALSTATGEDPVYDLTLTANCTLTLSATATARRQTVTLYLRQDGTGGRGLTLPAGIMWAGGSVPALSTVAGRLDVLTLTTLNGVQWIGSVVALGLAPAVVAPTPTVTLSVDQAKMEGASGATTLFVYTVTRSATTGAVNVVWSFAKGATDASDYTGGVLPAGGTVVLADGVASGTFQVSVAGDATFEGDETFSVSITVPAGYAAGARLSALGTILNDDADDGSISPEQRSLVAGVNLNGIDAYLNEQPWLDRVKNTEGFRTSKGGVSEYLYPGNADALFDADGWCTKLPEGKTELFFHVPAPGVGKPGVVVDEYVVRWQGGNPDLIPFADRATIVPGSQNGRRFVVRGALVHGAAMDLGFRNVNPTNVPHHIQVVRADQEALLDEWQATVTVQKPEGDLSKIWNPEFLADRAKDDLFRFMDWSSTNDRTGDFSWANRVGPTRYSYKTSTGVPIEVQAALCKKLGKVGHFNIPADYIGDVLNNNLVPIDTNIRALAKYLIAQFPDQPTWMEYSNETPWNFTFRGGILFNTIGYDRITGSDGKLKTLWEEKTGLVNWQPQHVALYYRTYVARILLEEWTAAGKAHLLRNCLGVQTTGEDQAFLRQVAATVFGFPGNAKMPGLDVAQFNEVFHTALITGYHSFSMFEAGRSPANAARLLQAARAGQPGILDAIQDWKEGGVFPFWGGAGNAPTCKEALRLAVENKRFADAVGLDLDTYEASCHMQNKYDLNNYAQAGGEPTTLTNSEFNELTDFLIRVVNSPEAYQLELDFMRALRSKGVGLYSQFTDVGSQDQIGTWGMRNYTGELTADGVPPPRARAYEAFVADPGPEKARPALDATVSTTGHSATVGAAGELMFYIRGGKGPYRIALASGTVAPGRSIKLKRQVGEYTTAGQYDAVYRVTDSSTPRQVKDVPISVTVAPKVVSGYKRFRFESLATGFSLDEGPGFFETYEANFAELVFAAANRATIPHDGITSIAVGTNDQFAYAALNNDYDSSYASANGSEVGSGPRPWVEWVYTVARRPAFFGIRPRDVSTPGPTPALWLLKAYDEQAAAWVTLVDQSAVPDPKGPKHNPQNYPASDPPKLFPCAYLA